MEGKNTKKKNTHTHTHTQGKTIRYLHKIKKSLQNLRIDQEKSKYFRNPDYGNPYNFTFKLK